MKAVVTDAKIGAAMAAATTSTGAGSWFGWIPSDVGLFAALVGAVLSIVLIVTHVGKFVLDYKAAKLKLEIRRREAEHRIERDLPLRWDEDD